MVSFLKRPDAHPAGSVRPEAGLSPVSGGAGAPARGPSAFDSLLRQTLDARSAAASGKPGDPGAFAEMLMRRMQVRAADRLLRLMSGADAGEVREDDGRLLEQLIETAARVSREAARDTAPAAPAAAEPRQTSAPAAAPGRTRPAAAAPAELAAVIDKAARQYGVDPVLVRCVIRAESNFRPGSTSPKGAMGLMQLMPGTARDLGVKDAYDPEENVLAGTRYLKSLLDRYGGDVPRALAAYNWGMGNVDRSPGRLPEETRRYVAGILREYRGSSA